jgi:hypothetical protein
LESESASEGTFAHALGELFLRLYVDGDDGLLARRYEEAVQDEYYSPDLEDYVKVYTDLVIEKYNAARAADENAIIAIEEKLDFSRWVPGGFGTGDAVIIADSVLEIIDFKFGRNVAVNAKNNSQLRLYALGAYDAFNCLYEFTAVKMTICQPRNGGISEEEISVSELLEWGSAAAEIANLASRGMGELKAGDHCRFCKAAVRCRAFSEYCLELAKLEFKDEELLSDDEIAQALSSIDALVSYATKLKEYALSEALNGRKWPGWKVVEGRSNSKYSDEDKIAATLIKAGFSEDCIYKPRELLGVTAMKKSITTKKFNKLLGELMVKPQGKPVLVRESDPRAEFNSAQTEFTKIEE